MPEGPEVKIVAQQLRMFVGQTLLKINMLSGPYLTGSQEKYRVFRNSSKKFAKSTLGDVQTKGKTMYWELSPQNAGNVIVNEYLVIGFGLTGGFRLTKQDHSRIEFVFADGKKTTSLYYNDMRNFGTFTFMKRAALNTKLDQLGPDAFTITEDELTEQLQMSSIKNHEIAKALLNQKIIAGIGNYLRAEILYDAGINPLVKVKDLTPTQISALHTSIHKIVDEVMSTTGSPNYGDLNENPGTYPFRVYGREVTPKGEPVQRTMLSGRAIYHV